MKTDLEKFKEFFDIMGICYTETTQFQLLQSFKIYLKVDYKHIHMNYGNCLEVVFDEYGKFLEFETWGE